MDKPKEITLDEVINHYGMVGAGTSFIIDSILNRGIIERIDKGFGGVIVLTFSKREEFDGTIWVENADTVKTLQPSRKPTIDSNGIIEISDGIIDYRITPVKQ